jgi:hypothetical protein
MPYNEGELQYGPVNVKYRYGWDGTSTRETTGCVGSLIQGTGVASNRWAIRVENTSPTATWYVHFSGRKGAPKVIDVPPGFVGAFNVAQSASRGFADSTDVEGLRITQSSTPPSDLIAR